MDLQKCLTSLGVFLIQFSSIAGNSVLADEPKAKLEGWITFVSHRSGSNLLYRMRPDGTELTAILGGKLEEVPTVDDGVTIVQEPHWTCLSPDRKYFAS